jgi:hypothetical protein
LGRIHAEAALAAALLVTGCAGAEALPRRDLDAVRAELAAARREIQQLERTVELLTTRVDALSTRLPRPGTVARPVEALSAEARPNEPVSVVPGGLSVVRMEPPRRAQAAPAVPTGVALVEPDASRLDALARRSGRELLADAEIELKAARRKGGLERAHALEGFVSRYPHHPQGDNALVEAAASYAAAGRPDAACTLARRAIDEYPAGDALAEALWQAATCESRRGATGAERRILDRLVSEFPSTPAARRAGERLASISGRSDGDPSPGVPARSSP